MKRKMESEDTGFVMEYTIKKSLLKNIKATLQARMHKNLKYIHTMEKNWLTI